MFEEGDHRAARAIFDPDILLELMKHKRKLEINLSPFLHGMSYTSFGRHFTKNEKLKEIVERLHWYVQSGDTVVDFCCGSNDFSCLMKEKLARMGKSCFFKIFDLIPPKNNFNFEKRDWLTVKPEEVDYIADYELIWENSNLLSGMLFYLPGSLNANNKTIEQWNNIPPPLYLWSRKDWSRSHKVRVLDQGHIIQMHHSTYNANIPQGHGKNGMVQDMDISPPLPPPPPRYGRPPPPPPPRCY